MLLDSANYATVTYKPGTIQFNAEKCKAVSGDAIYLEWTNMGTGRLYYLNQWIPDSTREQGGYWKVIASKLTAISYTVYDLEEDTEYYFALVAGPAEDDGRGLRYESDTISLTTLSDPYSFNINELRVEGTSCRVQWERVAGAYYKVEYIRNDRAPQIVSSRWSSEYIWLYGIPTNTDFSIRITAWVPDSRYTNNRFNIAVATKSARSGDFEPSITLDDITLTDGIAHLSWNALDGTTYTVYMSADGGQTSTPLAAELDTTYYDVSGLQGGKTYHFSVAAVCGSWKSTSEWLPVTIPDKSVGSIEYRALLIGEVSFKGTQYAARNYGDVELIASALSKARTPNGATYSVVRRKDLTANGICDAIWETFSDADEDDVSLLFIATHGDTYDMGQDAGYLSTVDPNGNQGYLDFYVLADELNRINGKVIVWLGSCGSGAAIYEHGVPQNGDEDFTANAMQAFSAYDDRNNAPVYVPSEFPGIAEEYETGEFRKEGKFYVLTAARYHQMSWGSEKERLNFFGKFLCEGITNTNGRMPADANGDDRVTQNELFRYIKSREEDDAEFINQNVQTYPQNSDYVLFVK